MSNISNHTPDSWEPNYRLGGACAIKHGFAFKGESMTTDASGDMPIVVNIVNFQYTGGFRFGDTKTQRYLGTYPLEYRLQPGDVLLVMTCQTPKGEILGVPGRIPSDGRVYLHNQRTGLVVLKDSSKLDLSFLYYLFISQDFNQHLFKTSTGAKILHTAPSRIEDFRFTRPPLRIQQQVASILSAYDDLIENNSRRIQILEQMAQMLYQEWFVNFRFPGHEKVKMVESELGPIPNRWRVDKVSEFILRLKPQVVYKESDVAKYGVVPVLDQSRDDVLGFHDNTPDFTANTDAPVAIFGDHTCKMKIVLRPFSVGPNVIPFTSTKTVPLAYVFFLVRGLVSTREYKRHWNELTNKVVVIAEPELAQKFAKLVIPMLLSIESLNRRTLNLRNTRDLLLPKLVSGEVSVEQIEQEVVTAMV